MRLLALFVSRYSAIAIQFLIVSLVAIKLPLSEAGVYFSLFGFVLATNYAAGLGLPDGVVKAFPALNANKQHGEASRLLGSSISLSLLSCLVIAVALCIVLWLYGNANYVYISLWWLSYGLTFVASQSLVATGRVQTGTFIFYSSISFSLLAIAVPFLLIADQVNLAGVLQLTVVSGLLASVLSLLWAFSNSSPPRVPYFDAALLHSWGYGIAVAVGRAVQAAIIWSPVWVAGILISHEAGALVGLATRLVSAVAAVIAAVRFSIRPRLASHAAAEQWNEIAGLGRRIAFWTTLLAAVALMGDVLLGNMVIGFVFGDSYAPAHILVAIFLLATLGESFGGPVDEVLKMSGGARVVLALQIAFGVISVALQYLFSLWFGIVGIAMGYALGFSAMYAAMIYTLMSKRGILIIPSAPDALRRALQWAWYFRYISPLKVAKKILHERASRLVVKDPYKYLQFPVAKGAPFSSPALLHFAQIYKAQGDRFVDAHLIYQGTFRVKGVEHNFGSLNAVHWKSPFDDDPSKLHWSHDLAFFSFTLPLAQDSPVRAVEAIATLVRRLEEQHPLQSPRLHFVWTPIALSLRLLGLCSAMAIARQKLDELPEGSGRAIAEHIALCSAILDSTAERYLGYNHQVFAEAALAVAKISLNLSATHAVESAVNSIERHVLDDGLWSERSPSYHIHMLLLLRALQALEATSPEVQQRMAVLVERMTNALDVVVHPDGEIAVLNDAAIEDSVPPSAVGWAPTAMATICKTLPQAGYSKLAQGGTTVIFDAGPMGPNDVIGHGHADFLSAQVSIGQKRLFIDPGVASIANDEKRRWTRSSEFHNGPRYEGLEPAEFFGAWRVGARGTAWLESAAHWRGNVLAVSGTCNGYSKKAGNVSREIELDADGTVAIIDTWSKPPRGLTPIAKFLIPDQWTIVSLDQSSIVLRQDGDLVTISFDDCTYNIESDFPYYSFGPLRKLNCHCLALTALGGRSEIIVRNSRKSSKS